MRFLTDQEVASLVSVEEAAAAVEGAFLALANDGAAVQTRVRTSSAVGKLSILGAVLDGEMTAGAKIYATSPEGSFCFAVVIFDPTGSRWLATMEGGELTRIRTAGTSLMAARALARADAEVLTVFGAGIQARTHALAFALGFPITEVRIVNRRHVPDLVEMMSQETGSKVSQLDDAESAVSGADLVVTATRSASPLFRGGALTEGAHVTSVGATVPKSRELDDATIFRATRVVVESREQARHEAGNLIGAGVDWDRVDELTDVAAGSVPGRLADEEITVFDSLGNGLEDIAVAALCYRKALESGLGTDLGVESGQLI